MTKGKIFVSRNDVRAINSNVKSTGYCSLYYLLINHNADGYNSGIYGWNYDFYNVYGLAITTGYRNLVGPACENVDFYENKAREIYADYSLSLDTRLEKIEALLQEFCAVNGGWHVENGRLYVS